MNRLVAIVSVAALALGLSACESDVRSYDNNDLQLVPAYTAKSVCSCLFVMGRTEDFCRDWTRANPEVTTFRIDRENKRVETGALMLWGARARFVDEKRGCVLE